MKLAVFVEGQTEECLREFIGRWLKGRSSSHVGIQIVKFNGAGEYVKEIAPRVRVALNTRDVAGAIGIIDFYASTLHYPDGPVATQYQWAKQEMESRVNHARFRQHFAVHETEAWLLSDLSVFPREIQGDLPKTSRPEAVNHRHPPGHRLKDLYWRKLNRKYNKPVQGSALFRKLSPEIAYAQCPHLQLLLDDILAFARGPEGFDH